MCLYDIGGVCVKNQGDVFPTGGINFNYNSHDKYSIPWTDNPNLTQINYNKSSYYV